MKTIEEKAKAYDKVLEKSKEFYSLCKKCGAKDTVDFLEDNFPELKESEDERIRKEIIAFIKSVAYAKMDDVKRYVAWLEKQDIFSKKDVDDAYLKGVTDTKNEIEKQYEENYQIRKDIATFIFNYRGDIKDRAKWMNYLGIKVSFVEKQDEQKPYGQRKECTYCQFNYAGECKGSCAMKRDEQIHAVNVESKFKVGNWVVTDKGDTIQIDAANPGYYTLSNGMEFCTSYVDKYWHLWTIQDAKDGDVLSDGTTIFIFKNLLSDGSVMSYCDYDTDSGESDAFCPLSVNLMCSKITPSTKEQRDLLFQKMKEADYEWDVEKKELNKIINFNYHKDDKMLYKIMQIVANYWNSIPDSNIDENEKVESCYNWLKSIKGR